MSIIFHTAKFSEEGRDNYNYIQDFIDLKSHPANEDCKIAVLTDGIEGHFGGREASEIANQKIFDAAFNLSPQKLVKSRNWEKILESVDKELFKNEETGFTAATGIVVYENKISGATCGECTAVLVCQNGKFDNFTKNIVKYPQLGSGKAAIKGFSSKFEMPATMLLLSTGVTKYVSCGKILSYTIQKKGSNLIESLYHDAVANLGSKLLEDFSGIALSMSQA